MTVGGKLRDFILPKLRVLTQFVAAQGLTAAANILYGLLCVRLLAPSDYAKFVVVFGVQGSLVSLMDLGVSNTIFPLIGERVDDRQLIADYVASFRSIARAIYLIIGAGLVFLYPMLVRNRGWSWPVIAAMIGILLVSTWFIRLNSAYGAVLLMLRDRSHWYRAQIHAALGTLALLCIVWAGHWLNAFTAIVINVSGLIYCAAFYYFRSRKLLNTAGHPSLAKVRAILRLSLPNAPVSFFYAIQGQLSLFFITFFGRTFSVASVGALGRLSQLFILLSQMNPILVEPYFAKLPIARLRSSYIAALALTATLCSAICVFAGLFPDVFLFILGPSYRNLHYEVLLAVVSGALSCFSGLLWTVHSARRFVYWWTNFVMIGLILIVQVAFAMKADLSSVRSILWLNLATNAAGVIGTALPGIYGFLKGARKGEDEPPTDAHLTTQLDPDIGGPSWEADHPNAADA